MATAMMGRTITGITSTDQRVTTTIGITGIVTEVTMITGMETEIMIIITGMMVCIMGAITDIALTW
jgi:hypothetical protein